MRWNLLLESLQSTKGHREGVVDLGKVGASWTSGNTYSSRSSCSWRPVKFFPFTPSLFVCPVVHHFGINLVFFGREVRIWYMISYKILELSPLLHAVLKCFFFCFLKCHSFFKNKFMNWFYKFQFIFFVCDVLLCNIRLYYHLLFITIFISFIEFLNLLLKIINLWRHDGAVGRVTET